MRESASLVTPLVFLLVVVCGIVAGILGALFGLGGGIIVIPVLTLLFGLPMHQAIAASIIAVIATSSATAAVYVDKGLTNIKLGMSLEVTTTIGALLGGITANYLSGDALRKIFAVFLLIMGTLMWLQRRRHGDARVEVNPHGIQGSYFDEAAQKPVAYSVRKLPFAMLVSVIAGNISGLLGVGGGVIQVPVMNMINGVPIKAATATSNFMIGVTAVASAFIYFSHGHVEPFFTSAAVLGVLIGSRFGTAIGAKIHSSTIIAMFICLMYIIAVRMFF